MSKKKYQVAAVGAAIVDILAHAADEEIEKLGVEKGSMALVDSERAASIYRKMGPASESSGGSAANMVASFASLGGRTAFVGKVARDQFGDIFSHDMRASGVSFYASIAESGATGRCLILVTEDAERTMCTDLGVSGQISADDIVESIFLSADIAYLEGYLWDSPANKEALGKVARATAAGNGCTALSLSDSFCVDRHRQSFQELVRDEVDILFANEAEIKALFETDDFEEAATLIREWTPLAALTRGAQGAVILDRGARYDVPAFPVSDLVDLTGAGDLFAAGFLFGLVSGKESVICGQMGCLAAATTLSHMGARPEKSDLSELFFKHGY